MRAGDVLTIDFGTPIGSEAGFRRPAVLVTADPVLEAGPRVVHVVPVTGSPRGALPFEVPIDAPGLDRPSLAQCHLCSAVSRQRILDTPRLGGIGSVQLAQIRSVLGDLLDLGA